ncbi:beta-glucuronidase-like [Stylophora pistillata]|uniref:beta-glucuronidase-like n=1 Tax=Stylophora pistillata TaxID=50429 RepID=UPI000C0570C8|nr:beta-glucuronidase-like [Stylophora pistillata]
MSMTCQTFLFILSLKCLFVEGFLRGMLYPRESETRQVKSLDGMWDFRADISSIGFDEMWYSLPLAQVGDVLSMPVPSSYNDITEDRWLRDFVGWVWYEKVFYVPPSWKSVSKRVVLRFDNVFYRCKVWLNSQEVLEHEGGDLPFEVDITHQLDSLERGSQRLTVAVNNTVGQPGKEEAGRSSSYCDSTSDQSTEVDFAGIHGSVKLYTTPAEVHLTDISVFTEHTYTRAILKFVTEVAAYNHVKSKDITMSYELLDRKGRMVLSTGGEGMFSGKVKVFFPTLWWPMGMSDEPGYLYNLKVITSYKGINDVYNLPVGFRTIRVEGSRVLINNVPLYFKGFGKRQDSDIRARGFDYATLIRDFNLIQWFGANSIRTSEHPPPEELLELADKYGIMVINESPTVGTKEVYQNPISEHAVNRHLDLLSELIQRDKNHPSVVMWCVASHSVTMHSGNIHAHLKRMMDFTREMDLQKRPVTYVTSSYDKLMTVEDPGLEFCDVISFNRHYGWYWYPGQPSLISKSLEEDLRGLHNVFGKPVLMAEYGSNAVAGRHKKPSVLYTEEYQVDTMKQYFPVFDRLRKEFLAGEMIWTLTDYNVLESYDIMSTNTKGLFTRQRQPKASAQALRQRYQALAVDTHPRFTGDSLLDVLIRFKPHEGDKYPLAIHNRLPALIREERVNTTIRKRSLDEIMKYYEP